MPGLAGEARHLLAVGDFATWEIGSQFILRFSSDDSGDAALEREAGALDVLGAALPVTIPRVALLETYGAGHLVMGYPKVHGVSGEDRRPPRAHWDAIADQVAEFLRALHGQRDVVPVAVPEGPTPVFDAQLADARRYRSVIEAHADGVLTNVILLDEQDGRLHAVIDSADIAFADPAVDLGSLAIWLGPSFVANVARRCALSQAEVDRGLFGIRVWMLTGFGRMLMGENSWPRVLATTQLRWAFGSVESP